jgi:penicillin-binding protein 2
MATSDHNLAGQSGHLVESHQRRDPRMVSLYLVLATLLLTLAGGLAYQQLVKSDGYTEKERRQSQRRVIVPGPRGTIYARNGTTILVGNRPRLSVVLYLDELRSEFVQEASVIRRNYKGSDIKDAAFFNQLAHVSVAQRYLDQVNRILGREEKVNFPALHRHFNEQLLLPYHLVDDLTEQEYAQLIERLPATSSLQLYTSSMRDYPYGSAAAHTLGFIRASDDTGPDLFPREEIKTFKIAGTVGKDGLERSFDAQLHGVAGGSLFRVDHAGYKVNPPLERHLPIQGKDLVTSLDIDLQIAAEIAIGDRVGAAVALDVKTGEVLVLASKPDYDLSEVYPRLSHAKYAEIESAGGWLNRAVNGLYRPGSTFKLVTTIAALRSGIVSPDEIIADCRGTMLVGGSPKTCDNGHARHGPVTLPEAIAVSCDVYYYTLGLKTTPQTIAAEARRFGLDRRTGIELPTETGGMLIPDPEWKRRRYDEKWYPGDTANMAIGQGAVVVTPLEMACFAASLARDEVSTKPTLVHDPDARPQHSARTGLTADQRAALVAGMIDCTRPTYAKSTAYNLSLPAFKVPGVTIAGKTGTAQSDATIKGKTGTINTAWFICFAPAENPEIAVAVMLEGDTIGEAFAGGENAGPVATTILKKYFEKKNLASATARASKGE